MRQISTGRSAHLVHELAPVPHARAPLDDSDDLGAEARRELLAPGAGGALLVDDVEDPHDGHAAAGARVDGLRDVERVAAACHPL